MPERSASDRRRTLQSRFSTRPPAFQSVTCPVRITSQALPDLASGDLQLSVQYVPTFVPNVQSGMLTGLAVTSPKRMAELPDVPTVAEQGYPGFEANGWTALFAPAGTPADIVSKVNQGVNEYLAAPPAKSSSPKSG